MSRSRVVSFGAVLEIVAVVFAALAPSLHGTDDDGAEVVASGLVVGQHELRDAQKTFQRLRRGSLQLLFLHDPKKKSIESFSVFSASKMVF